MKSAHAMLLCAFSCAAMFSAHAQPQGCPTADAVAVSAVAPGWTFVPYPGAYDAPKPKLDTIEVVEGYVRCKYDLGAGGMVRVQLSKACKPEAGTWKRQGTSLDRCSGAAVAKCTFSCSPG
jgi:hypothetical protein